MTTEDSTIKRQCHKCFNKYPPTSEYFTIDKRKPDGITYRCRVCDRAYHNDYYIATKPIRRQQQKEYEKRRDIEERRASDRRYYHENHEHVLEVKANWRDNNRDKVNEIARNYYKKHPEICRERTRVFREKHPEYTHEYHEKNKERRTIQIKQWRDNNPEMSRAITRKYRARKRQVGGSHTGKDIKLIFRSQKGLCWWCGCELDPNHYHVDHRIAIAKGGHDSPSNLCISCPRCNMSKQDKYSWEWNGRLL